MQPLAEIQDPDALDFENSSTPVNIAGLTSPTARALARFERIVTSLGGTFALTSAYRPAAYQEHLQAVWDKWMLELRPNRDGACLPVRMSVEAEFIRHALLESQRPVPYSDHTRGIAFDAAVILPVRARGKRRVASVDRLARMAGVRRPAIARDRVHFRLI